MQTRVHLHHASVSEPRGPCISDRRAHLGSCRLQHNSNRRYHNAEERVRGSCDEAIDMQSSLYQAAVSVVL